MSRKRKEKTSFVMHLNFKSSLKDLTDAEYRELIEGMFEYTETRIRPTFSNRVIDIAFNPIQEKMDEDYESWKITCDNRSKAKQDYDEKQKNANSTQEPQSTTIVHNCEPSAQEPQSITNASEYDYEYDCDLNINSVCNNNAHVRDNQNICHLGSNFKTEQCFNCMKKNICPHKESAEFKLRHPEETFVEWCQRKTDAINQIVEERNARGQPISQEEMHELFEDYNWLEDSENEKKEGRI